MSKVQWFDPEGTEAAHRKSHVEELIAKWRDPEFWKDHGNVMDSTDCADELEQALAADREGRQEPRNWKGVRWIDSIKMRNLAEKIGLHFAHDCNDSVCGEDADASNCEVAWIEDELSDFLDEQAKTLAAQPIPERPVCDCPKPGPCLGKGGVGKTFVCADVQPIPERGQEPDILAGLPLHANHELPEVKICRRHLVIWDDNCDFCKRGTSEDQA